MRRIEVEFFGGNDQIGGIWRFNDQYSARSQRAKPMVDLLYEN